ncbi:shikimate dehydrogenase AroE [Methyloglobulus morosus KoM1]|uniref:Shikimate dehydrogenase (NADP(+)) n=1 Tax=Methyloglobulus morosus KoM1 TaxID=1116472 RepID=V5BYC0_9GAMM|nr:shikimate dehydrogenase [Methyloglobulus morosus]ESS72839.1 shikimate dehydrogenase AroE [Methyloglobulus morosus KoM1]
MSNKDRYAVFGSPIKHSKSPRIHQLFAEQTQQSLEYTAEEVPADKFKESVDRFFSQGGKGLNCTLPLKELAWAYADHNTERANLSKAVNTLALQDDGSILGDNTDGCGLVADLNDNHDIFLKNSRILILGAGGATRGIIAPILEKSPQQLVIANRTSEKARDLAEGFRDWGKIIGCGFAEIQGHQFDLIINATSASLYDELPPLAENLLAEGGVCYDLAYGGKPTSFVRWGVSHKAQKSLDGLGMLVEQAAEAFFLWRGVRPKTKPVIERLNFARGFV